MSLNRPKLCSARPNLYSTPSGFVVAEMCRESLKPDHNRDSVGKRLLRKRIVLRLHSTKCYRLRHSGRNPRKYEGEDLAANEAALRERIGPPAPNLAALHGAELFSPGAWYVEAFEALRE